MMILKKKAIIHTNKPNLVAGIYLVSFVQKQNNEIRAQK